MRPDLPMTLALGAAVGCGDETDRGPERAFGGTAVVEVVISRLNCVNGATVDPAMAG